MTTDTVPTVPELIGGSPATERGRRVLAQAIGGLDPLLISTEVGLDAVAVARAVHEGGSRAAHPCVVIDCAAPFELDRAIRPASGGTLVLTNLDGLSSQLQGRLALALRDGQIDMPGSECVPLEFRAIATVCGNIDEEIRDGKLRRDLCVRFGLRLDLPPLRHRPADIPTLIGCVMAESAAASRVPVPTFSREALALLSALPWRRNFEELREVLDVLVLSAAGGAVRLEDVLGQVPIERMSSTPAGPGNLRDARLRFEREYITGVLQRHRWRMDDAARTLGIQRTNLYRKVRQLGIGRAKVQK